jgi:hypothetical protein
MTDGEPHSWTWASCWPWELRTWDEVLHSCCWELNRTGQEENRTGLVEVHKLVAEERMLVEPKRHMEMQPERHTELRPGECTSERGSRKIELVAGHKTAAHKTEPLAHTLAGQVAHMIERPAGRRTAGRVVRKTERPAGRTLAGRAARRIERPVGHKTAGQVVRKIERPAERTIAGRAARRIEQAQLHRLGRLVERRPGADRMMERPAGHRTEPEEPDRRIEWERHHRKHHPY